MTPSLNEFDILKTCLPLEQNIAKYLCVKTKVNNYDDLEFRMEGDLEKTVRKFAHYGWTDMRPLVIGIKCYTNTGCCRLCKSWKQGPPLTQTD